jgi:hypothetical protein
VRGASGTGSGRPAPTLRPMHGMLSAAILIVTFAAIAAAGLYLAGRVYLAGGRGNRGSGAS